MEDSSFSKSDKIRSEFKMYTTELLKAKDWYDECMDAEHRGRKDTNGSARARLAEFCALSESMLVRLEYNWRDMKDVSGKLYRRLELGYKALCEHNEDAAEELKQERLALKAQRHETYQGSSQKGKGNGAALD